MAELGSSITLEGARFEKKCMVGGVPSQEAALNYEEEHPQASRNDLNIFWEDMLHRHHLLLKEHPAPEWSRP